jgi:hypothetical protein
MNEQQFFERLDQIARLLVGDYRETVGEPVAYELELRIERHDWMPADIVWLREALPVRLRWLLRIDDRDDE